MQEIYALIDKANRLFQTADHLTYVTYPVVNDVKLIITIMENIYSSLIAGMEAILNYDRMYKRISPLPDNFSARLDVFKNKCAPRYNIDRNYILLINDLKNILEQRKKSQMEFVRKDKFVIMNGSFRAQTLTIDKVKLYLSESKEFINKLNKIFQNDRRRY